MSSLRQNRKPVNPAAELSQWDEAWPGFPDEPPELDVSVEFDPIDIIDPTMDPEDVSAAWLAAVSELACEVLAAQHAGFPFGHLDTRDN